MNDGDISTGKMNEPEQVSEEDKKFLYARAVHSNHSIQYHMQQIIEQQKVVNKYRSMMMEGMSLTSLESNPPNHANDRGRQFFGTKRPLMQSWPTSREDGMNESMNREMCPHTVQKTVKSMIEWME